MSTGVMYYESAIRAHGRRTPGGLPGAVVRAGRLLELWGYRAARSARPVEQFVVPMGGREALAQRVGGASSTVVQPHRFY
jgi:hypothetical protein